MQSDPLMHMLLQVLSSCRILSAPVVSGSDSGDGDYQVRSLRLMSTAGDSLPALRGCCNHLNAQPSALPEYAAVYTALAQCLCMQSPLRASETATKKQRWFWPTPRVHHCILSSDHHL